MRFHAKSQGERATVPDKGFVPEAFFARAYFYSRWCCRLGFVLLLCCSLTVAQSAEYRAKAGFLAAFPNFVEWPDLAFSSNKAPLLICVFGDFLFGTSLAELTRASVVRGRRVEVRWIHKEQELRLCQILFVSRSESGRYAQILKTLQGASVLTVGETDGFLRSGGAIRLLVADDRLQFEVNTAVAAAAHIRISSTMLALAHHQGQPETANVNVANHRDSPD